MSKILWALAALTLFACDGGGPSGDGHHTDDTDTGVPPGESGSLFVHATYGGATEICTVNSPNGELGSTEETISGLAPGSLDFQLGDMSKTTLDGVPFHVTGGGDYLIGGGHATIEKGAVAQAEVTLEQYPEYRCQAFVCDYPYEGGGCSQPMDPEDQNIYVDNDGMLHGSDSDYFGGQDGIVKLNGDGTITVTTRDELTTVIDSYLDATELSFGYTLNNDAAQVTFSVGCSLKR